MIAGNLNELFVGIGCDDGDVLFFESLDDMGSGSSDAADDDMAAEFLCFFDHLFLRVDGFGGCELNYLAE